MIVEEGLDRFNAQGIALQSTVEPAKVLEQMLDTGFSVLFAQRTWRKLQLFTLAPFGDEHRDAVRLAIFRISILLLDKTVNCPSATPLIGSQMVPFQGLVSCGDYVRIAGLAENFASQSTTTSPITVPVHLTPLRLLPVVKSHFLLVPLLAVWMECALLVPVWKMRKRQPTNTSKR